MLAPFPLSYLPQSFGFFALVLILALSLMMVFVGSRLIQWLSFGIVGLMTAYFGTVAGNEYGGPLGALVGFVFGFVIGGASILLFLPLGLGLGVGLGSFAAAQLLCQIPFVPPLVGIVGFSYGFLLTDLLLSAISALVGGVLIFSAGLAAGFPPLEMLLGCGALSACGTATQAFLARRAHTLFGRGGETYRSRRLRKNRIEG